MVSEVQPEIIKRIQNLEALRQGAKTEHEAAVAAAMVRKLLDKHNLELGSVMLKRTGAATKTGIVVKRKALYIRGLAKAVEVLMGVGSFWNVRPGMQECVFFGSPANVEAACATLPYLIASVWVISKQCKPKQRRDFMFGASIRINEMAKRFVEKQRAAESVESMALVRVTDAIVKEFQDNLKDVKKFAQPTTKAGSDAVHQGYLAAGSIDIHGAKTIRLID